MSNPFLNQLKHQFRSGNMHIRLILLNVLVFFIINILLIIGKANPSLGITEFVSKTFTLQTDPELFIRNPWGLFTSIFSHVGFFHLLMNMLFLYFAGNMFLQLFSNRRLLHVYIIGGIVGGLLELLSRQLLAGNSFFDYIPVVGASGSVMALFIAVAVHRPNIQVYFFGLFPVRLIVLAGIYVLMDLLQIRKGDGIAHFAHLGGALIGFLSVRNLHSSYNIINMSETFGQRFKKFWAGIFKPGPKMRVEKGGRPKTDEQFNAEKTAKQEKINKILDKISKSGYESLTKAEKEFLFSQSQK